MNRRLMEDLQAAVPKYTGTLPLRGLAHPVQIYRDQLGIPHLRAHLSARCFLRPGVCARPRPPLANGFRPSPRLW